MKKTAAQKFEEKNIIKKSEVNIMKKLEVFKKLKEGNLVGCEISNNFLKELNSFDWTYQEKVDISKILTSDLEGEFSICCECEKIFESTDAMMLCSYYDTDVICEECINSLKDYYSFCENCETCKCWVDNEKLVDYWEKSDSGEIEKKHCCKDIFDAVKWESMTQCPNCGVLSTDETWEFVGGCFGCGYDEDDDEDDDDEEDYEDEED